MIKATENDIGRRVIYDPRPILKTVSRGVVAGIDGYAVMVQFDDARYPLRVFSNLRWDDKK